MQTRCTNCMAVMHFRLIDLVDGMLVWQCSSCGYKIFIKAKRRK